MIMISPVIMHSPECIHRKVSDNIIHLLDRAESDIRFVVQIEADIGQSVLKVLNNDKNVSRFMAKI